MALVVIDTSTDPEVLAYEQFVDLDLRTYLIKFDWITSDESWVFSIYDQDEDPIVQGKKVVIGIDLLRGIRDSRKPTGLLIAVDTTEQHQEADVSTLGAGVKLMYADAAEIAAVAA